MFSGFAVCLVEHNLLWFVFVAYMMQLGTKADGYLKMCRSGVCYRDGTPRFAPLALRGEDCCISIHKQAESCENSFMYADRVCAEMGMPKMHIFAQEFPVPTRQIVSRRFVVASMAAFYNKYYAGADSKSLPRTWHQVIRDGFPCHFYYDIDWRKGISLAVKNLDTFHHLIRLVACSLLDATIESFAECEASTPAKFSVHGIVHLRGLMFVDKNSCRRFMDTIRAVAVLLGYHELFYCDAMGHEQFFPCDAQVYASNHTMRMIGSTKVGELRYFVDVPSWVKYDPLKRSKTDQPEISLPDFLRHSVTDIEPITAQSTRLVSMLIDPVLALQSFSNTLCGVPNEINSSVEGVVHISDGSLNSRLQEFIAAKEGTKLRVVRETDQPHRITFASTSHYCRIARLIKSSEKPVSHVSNFVYYVVDVDKRIYWQRCHDEVCKVYMTEAYSTRSHRLDCDCELCARRRKLGVLRGTIPDEIYGTSTKSGGPEESVSSTVDPTYPLKRRKVIVDCSAYTRALHDIRSLDNKI